MFTVHSLKEILTNLQTLDKYRKSSDKSERIFWENLMKFGKCFVVWKSENSLLVGPSRFLGYFGNDLLKHNTNKEKDGKETNKALYRLMGRCSPNDALDKEFVVFCSREGIVPSNKQRKYWIA